MNADCTGLVSAVYCIYSLVYVVLPRCSIFICGLLHIIMLLIYRYHGRRQKFAGGGKRKESQVNAWKRT